MFARFKEIYGGLGQQMNQTITSIQNNIGDINIKIDNVSSSILDLTTNIVIINNNIADININIAESNDNLASFSNNIADINNNITDFKKHILAIVDDNWANTDFTSEVSLTWCFPGGTMVSFPKNHANTKK